MIEVLGENYYIDFKKLEDAINIPKTESTKKSDDEETDEDAQHISVVKFEVVKMMLEVIMSEREDVDENLGVHSVKNLSIPFKLSFNTLLMNGIIKHL